MKRGEIWTVSGGPGYAGKPRPALIVQDDLFPTAQSATICGFTTELTESPFVRPLIEPSPDNGLMQESKLMVDKITTIPRSRFGRRIGVLSPAAMAQVERALLVFLGLAG